MSLLQMTKYHKNLNVLQSILKQWIQIATLSMTWHSLNHMCGWNQSSRHPLIRIGIQDVRHAWKRMIRLMVHFDSAKHSLKSRNSKKISVETPMTNLIYCTPKIIWVKSNPNLNRHLIVSHLNIWNQKVSCNTILLCSKEHCIKFCVCLDYLLYHSMLQVYTV